MKNKICTSIEQSKKLIELGLDVKTADMFWDTAEPEERRTPTVGLISDYYDMEDWAVPAWSIAALLDVLPKGTRLLKSATDDIYHCDCPKCNIDEWFDNPIDACVEMVCWLLENGKI